MNGDANQFQLFIEERQVLNKVIRNRGCNCVHDEIRVVYFHDCTSHQPVDRPIDLSHQQNIYFSDQEKAMCI